MSCLLSLFSLSSTNRFCNSQVIVPTEQIVTPMPYTTDHLYVLHKNDLYKYDIAVLEYLYPQLGSALPTYLCWIINNNINNK